MTFASAVTLELERRRMTVHELARRTGIAHPRLYQWLNGTRGIGLKVCEKVAADLGLQLSPAR